MRKIATALALAITCVIAWNTARANGPIGATGTTPRTYATGSFPITYRVDQGGLGSISNATATSIVDFSFGVWDTVATANLSFTKGAQLPRNVTSPTDTYISGNGQFSDGVNPIVFDSSGAITDGQLGSGASSYVLGYSTSGYTGNTYIEGYAVINGKLTGSGSASVQDQYRATMTHEFGHFLGLGHAQNSVHSDYATMYPIIETSNQRFLEPDDVSSISVLYPATGFLSSVGTITGTVKRPNGANLSGVNVVAMDTLTKQTYTTVVDYFSGGRVTFDSPPTASGTYTLKGLPPGMYYVQIQPINSNFTSGSLIGSYQNGPPSQSASIAREWYNGANETGDMLNDNTDEKTAVAVTAGGTTTGINFVSNESATISTLSYHNGTNSIAYPIPNGTTQRYASRFTSPASGGSLVSVKFRFDGVTTLPVNGVLTVAVYTHGPGSTAGIPTAQLGSVTIPFSCLSADQDNEVWLRGLGSVINFAGSTDFHVVFSTNSVGAPRLWFDNGSGTASRTSYYTAANGWRNMNNTMIASCLFSSQQVSAPPAVGLSATDLDFGNLKLGQTFDKTVTITNTGTNSLDVTATTLTGTDPAEFVVVANGAPFSLAGGSSRTISIRFSPTSTGAKAANLSIASNGTGSPNTVALTGNGTQVTATVLANGYDFGKQNLNGTYSQTIALIHNTGNDTLKISSGTMGGADGGTAIKMTTNQLIVLPDSVYRAKFQFIPTERRTYTATLTLVHDDVSRSPQTFTITGEGVSGELNTSVSSIDFGQVLQGSQADTVVQLRNVGNAPFSITTLGVSGAASARFTIVNGPALPVVVSPDDSLTVTLRFKPTTSATYNANLNVQTTASASSTQIPLTGQGVNPILQISKTEINFGDVFTDSTRVDSFTISNTGTAPLVNINVSLGGANSSAFQLNAPSGFTLAPSQSQTVRVTLLPQTVVQALTAIAQVSTETGNGQVNLMANIKKQTGGSGVLDGAVTGGSRIELLPVQPNPAVGRTQLVFNVQGLRNVPVTLTIVDVHGHNVATIFTGSANPGTQRFDLDLSTVAAGEYFAVLESGKGRLVEKFVVVK